MSNNRDDNGIDTSDWIVELPKDHPALTEDVRRKFREALANVNVADTYPRTESRIPDDLELMYPASVGTSIRCDPRDLRIDRRHFNNLSRAVKNHFMHNLIRSYRKVYGHDKP